MGKATYQFSWERTYPWKKAVNGDQSKAFCKFCQKSFSISCSGQTQVNNMFRLYQIGFYNLAKTI